MKLVAVAITALVVACSSKKDDKPRDPAPASGTAVAMAVDAAAAVEPPKPAGFDVCAMGKTALEAASCGTATDRNNLLKAKKSLDGIIDTVKQLDTGGDQTKFQVMCAQLLIAIERDAAKATCTLKIDAGERAEMMKILDAWFAQRTPVTPTGDAAADAVIAKIVAVRDATCECKDGACLDRVGNQIAAIGKMPDGAPQAARDLGSKLLEDAARCANRVRTITDPPK